MSKVEVGRFILRSVTASKRYWLHRCPCNICSNTVAKSLTNFASQDEEEECKGANYGGFFEIVRLTLIWISTLPFDERTTPKKSARAAGQVETPTDEQTTVRRRSFLTRGSQTDASDPEIFRPEKRIDFREQKPPPLALRESDGTRVTGRE